jgi:hypothetical protein
MPFYGFMLHGLFFFIGVASTSAFDTEVISDISAPAGDERQSLEIKNNQFWQAIQEAAKDTQIDQHILVYAEVQAAIEGMPAENQHVGGLLTDALALLRHVDEIVLEEALSSYELASGKIASGPAGEGAFSFLSGGQNYFSLMIRRFVHGGQYTERVSKHVADRQADILPALRGAASVSGNLLKDCRETSRLGFDVLKYDIYNKDVPKTPESAKVVAHKLIDAAGQTRHRFMRGIVGMANAIAKDTQEKDVDPAAKVTQSLLTDLTPFGSKLEEHGSGFNVAHEERFAVNGKQRLNF